VVLFNAIREKITMIGFPYLSQCHVKNIQAAAHPVGIVMSDVVQLRQLPPAVGTAVDLLGHEAQFPVGPSHLVPAIFHGVVKPGRIIYMGEHQPVKLWIGAKQPAVDRFSPPRITGHYRQG